MSRTIRALVLLLIVLALVFAGFQIGKRMGRSAMQTQMIENYSFVRDIAELASLEVNGVVNFTASNVANDGSFSDAFKRFFAEKTVHLSVPYTAKYGVDLSDSNMRMERKDSVLLIHLPQPKLLSYELRLDRADQSSREGILLSSKADLYTVYQKQLYTNGRQQLEGNAIYRSQAAERVSKLLERYFATAELKAHCVFDQPPAVSIPKD